MAVENGKYSPTLELAFAIAKVFGKPLEEVFSTEEEKAIHSKHTNNPNPSPVRKMRFGLFLLEPIPTRQKPCF